MIDAFWRLRKVVRKSDSTVLGEFCYDSQNRRVYHTAPFVDASTYGNTRRYVYNGAQMFTEYFNSSGELLHEQFVYGTYLDEVWVRERKVPNGQGGYNSEYLFFHHDPLYSVCGITDTAGNLLEAYEYDPYGKREVITDGPDPDSIVNFTTDDVRSTDSPRFVKPAFTGQRFDLESGLYYYKERYYHPTLGRFISKDPVGFEGGINLYRYCENNPLNHTDPDGRIPIWLERIIKHDGYLFWRSFVLDSTWRDLMDDWYYELGTDPRMIIGLGDSHNSSINANIGFQKLLACWVYQEILGRRAPTGRWSIGRDCFQWQYTFDRSTAAGGRAAFDSATNFFGTYTAKILNRKSIGADWLVKIQIINISGWSSGTRLPGFAARFLGVTSLFTDHTRRGARYTPSRGGNMRQYYEFYTSVSKCPTCSLP